MTMERLGGLHMYFQFIELIALAVNKDLVVTCQARMGEQDLFDLRREDVDAAHDEHIIAAPTHPLHTNGRASTGAGAVVQSNQVACAIAQKWERFTRQASQDQFADCPLRQRLACLGVDHFGIEIVLIDMKSVMVRALEGDAGANYFGEAVKIKSLDSEAFFDLLAHAFGPRFRPEEAGAHLHTAAQIDTCLGGNFGDYQRVGRRTGDDRAAEIFHQLELAARQATAHRNDGCSDKFRSNMQAQAAGKKPVAIEVLKHVVGGHAASGQGACHHFAPHLQVGARVASNHGFAGCATRSVQAYHITQGHSEEAIGIRGAEVVFDREGKARNVVERLNILWLHAALLQCLPVERHALVSAGYLLLQTLRL